MPSGDPRSVLVVDEEPAIRDLLRLALTERGFSVCVAGSAPEALEACRRHLPAVALLETDLGRVDVKQFLGELVRIHPPIRLCLMSGGGSAESSEELGRLGVVRFFSKPFSLQTLFESLEQVIVEAGRSS
jgi:DNA-binding NtrC family response regulator